MADIHIDDFYRDVAKIFLRLYAQFPRKTILYVEDISGPDQPDEFGLHNPRFHGCFSTMVWLADHDYLCFEGTILQEALDQVVLSQKAFLILTSRSELDAEFRVHNPSLPPSVAQEFQSNIAQLRGAMKDGSSIMIKNCVRFLLDHSAVGIS